MLIACPAKKHQILMHLLMNNPLQVSKPLKKVEDPKKTVEEPKETEKPATISKGKKSADAVSV